MRTTTLTAWARRLLLHHPSPTTLVTPHLKHLLPQTTRPRATTPTSTFVNCARKNSLSTHQHVFVLPSPQDPRIFLAHVHPIHHHQASTAASKAATLASICPQPQIRRRKSRNSISFAKVSAEQPARASTRNMAKLLDRQLWHTGRYVALASLFVMYCVCLVELSSSTKDIECSRCSRGIPCFICLGFEARNPSRNLTHHGRVITCAHSGANQETIQDIHNTPCMLPYYTLMTKH